MVLLFEEAFRLGSFFEVVLVDFSLSFSNILDKLPGADIIPKITDGRVALVDLLLNDRQILPCNVKLLPELRYLRVQFIDLGVTILQCSGAFGFDVPRNLSVWPA